MIIATWNLNHRTKRKPISKLIVPTLASLKVDIVVFTEFVDGPTRTQFRADLCAIGLEHISVSDTEGRHNQVLIASRFRHRLGIIKAPPILPSTPSNFLHIRVPQLNLDVLGIRIPYDISTNLQHWNWLLIQASQNRFRLGRTIIIGDFNLDVGPSGFPGSENLARMRKMGWKQVLPKNGCSYFTVRGRVPKKLDYAFLSCGIQSKNARYVHKFRKTPLVGLGGSTASDHALLVIGCHIDD